MGSPGSYGLVGKGHTEPHYCIWINILIMFKCALQGIAFDSQKKIKKKRNQFF